MAHIEGCRHTLDITIPAEAVQAETVKVLEDVRKKAHIQGFRPGKAPANLIRQRFAEAIRQEVLDNLLPKYLDQEFEKEHLQVVSRPEIKDLHFHDGESVHFKAEFEVAPEFELKEVRGLKVPYAEPSVSEADVEKRIEEIRNSKAEFVNLDPRPAVDGDHALVSLESLSGVDGPAMKQDELSIEVGGADTFAAFSDALRSALPGDEREAEITYPADYAEPKLAGKTVKFKVTLKSLRKKELPELNDEFAKDLGDFQTMDELKEEIRKGMFRELEYTAQMEAKNKLIELLVDSHEFPVPEAFVERQVENNLESQLRTLAAQGVDVSKLKLDWNALKQRQYERAQRDVKASLILEKVADSETIEVLQDELDKEVQRIARQEREPVAATRMRLEKDGSLRRIASRIRTEKTLSFLFEHATKEAPAPEAPAADAPAPAVE
jgi:trigger factor